MIFVNSMSDLFHKAVPKARIVRVFDTIERANWHIYQILGHHFRSKSAGRSD